MFLFEKDYLEIFEKEIANMTVADFLNIKHLPKDLTDKEMKAFYDFVMSYKSQIEANGENANDMQLKDL